MTGTVRFARLRSLDTEATRGPWRVRDINVVEDEGGYDVAATVHGSVRQARADAALIAAMRNAWPAMVTLVEGVLEDGPAPSCPACHEAALAVLDTLDPP
jgi:hypothetical protein